MSLTTVASCAGSASENMLLDQAQVGTFAQLDHVAQVPGEFDVGSRTDEYQLHRCGDLPAGGNAQHLHRQRWRH